MRDSVPNESEIQASVHGRMQVIRVGAGNTQEIKAVAVGYIAGGRIHG
jgi:hypothetical protein